MASQIFLNLPVKDLDKSVAFFTALGYTFNAQFTNEQATCMIVSDSIFVMLLVEPFFKSFIDKEIADTTKTTEALIGISIDTKAKIDEMVNTAVNSGGKALKKTDEGWMYSWAYEDLDGHIWELIWMDPAGMPQS
ncbi:VOC family protein [Mucilaginibacter agri]|uniref:Glyoxalase/bleomycin resistance/extradiol dioxygenase family protein n=1 Tax=Mucilaginibacter agri TaxID=2695265 RepID=A0A966DU29_9SPHI|nr:VOC family protein [Mucilaginibacter agri]NCD69264.1 glyoxalase/bleomycin resistance/extradiol dioxygenase family protein [Mucilaginibacter agri]